MYDITLDKESNIISEALRYYCVKYRVTTEMNDGVSDLENNRHKF
jgi:hypothetical protein